jgi:hypothetical protein
MLRVVCRSSVRRPLAVVRPFFFAASGKDNEPEQPSSTTSTEENEQDEQPPSSSSSSSSSGNFNRNDLIAIIAKEHNMPRADAGRVLTTIFDTIVEVRCVCVCVCVCVWMEYIMCVLSPGYSCNTNKQTISN